MSEHEVQIADGPAPPEPSPPYRNLWVPLFVVPAGIVIAIVVIFALFGSLSGSERSLDENLDLVVRGGKNQREQALFNLARQSAENQSALARGEDAPWAVEEGFADRVAKAIEDVDEDEYLTRLTLAALLAGVDPRGVEELYAFLDLGDGVDPERKLRFGAVSNLGQLARAGLVPDPEAALGRLRPFLGHDDLGLRNLTVSAVGELGGEEARKALEGALGDGSLEVRGTAAFSLAALDPPGYGAAPVLRDLTAVETYAAVRAEDPRKFARARDVSGLRIRAVEALAQLGRAEDWRFIEGLRGDADPNVVDAVLRVLKHREEG